MIRVSLHIAGWHQWRADGDGNNLVGIFPFSSRRIVRGEVVRIDIQNVDGPLLYRFPLPLVQIGESEQVSVGALAASEPGKPVPE